MAEESGGASWWGTWGAEFISNVREKSAEAMTMVKQDLSEFVCTIQHDTSAVVADTATAVKESLKVEDEEEQEGTSAYFKQGVSKFLGTLSNSLRENISHVASAAAEVTSTGPEPVFDRMQARLHEIQTDPATFCSEPDGHLAMYEEWCKTFDPEQHKGEISELLVNVPEIRALYAKLVPSAVTHVLFWQRYFYKVHQLQQEEKKRAALVARANQAQDEDLGWGDDEDLWDTDEVVVDSQPTSKHAANEDSKESIPDETNLTETGEQESVKEVSSVTTTEEAKEPVSQETASLEKLDKPVLTSATARSELSQSEEMGEGKNLELKEPPPSQEDVTQEQAKLPSQRTEQPSQYPTNIQEQTDTLHESSPSELSKTPGEDTTSAKPADAELLSTLHKRENSSGSVDSSWSKLSEEELKANSDKEAGSKDTGTSSGSSSTSSGSGVLVPRVDDKDVEWDDDDDDLDLNEDMSEEEVKRIMQSIEDNKKNADEDAGDDDDDWENWD